MLVAGFVVLAVVLVAAALVWVGFRPLTRQERAQLHRRAAEFETRAQIDHLTRATLRAMQDAARDW